MALSVCFHRYTKLLSGRSTWQQSAFIDRGPAWSANRGCGWIWTAKCHGGHWGEVQVLQVSYVGKWSRIESTSLAFLWNVVYIYLVTLNRWLSGTCEPPATAPNDVISIGASSSSLSSSSPSAVTRPACPICIVSDPTHALLPCGHSTLCNACAVWFSSRTAAPYAVKVCSRWCTSNPYKRTNFHQPQHEWHLVWNVKRFKSKPLNVNVGYTLLSVFPVDLWLNDIFTTNIQTHSRTHPLLLVYTSWCQTCTAL